MSNEKEFPKGIMFKEPHAKAPDFVLGKLSIKIDEAIEYLKEKAFSGEQWVNFQAKISKGGKYYLELDTWKPKNGGSGQQSTDNSGNIPF